MTPACRTVRELLPGFQGPAPEATPDEEARVRGHIAGCPSCRAEYERTLAVGRLVAALATVETPAPSVDPIGLVARLGRPRTPRWVPAAATLVAVLAGVIGLTVWPRTAADRDDAADYWIGAVVVSLPDGAAEVPPGVPPDPPGYHIARLFDGPARAGGVRVGDRVTAIDGVPVAGAPIRVLPPAFRPGDLIDLTVLRAGRLVHVPVRPAPRPAAGPVER